MSIQQSPRNKPIYLSVIFAFITVIFLTFLVQLTIGSELIKKESYQTDVFFSQDFSKSKNIVLIGSSYVGEINATLVNNILNEESSVFSDRTVYNLARAGDIPVRRISDVDSLISMKPELVLYGISYRDFKVTREHESNLLDNFYKILLDVKIFDFEFHNPQLLTRIALSRIFDLGSEKADLPKLHEEEIIDPYTPFFPYEKFHFDLRNDTELASLVKEEPWDNPYAVTENIHALDKFIEKMSENNIPVVLIGTPVHKYYSDFLTQHQKEQFLEILNYFERKHNVPIYDFTTRYENSHIWQDLTHITLQHDGAIYSEDISKIILQELNT